jgi:flagellar biosynthesis chaperone FliJ
LGSIYSDKERIERIETFCGITDMMVIDKLVFNTMKDEVHALEVQIEKINDTVDNTILKIRESNILMSKTQLDLINATKELKKFEKLMELVNK